MTSRTTEYAVPALDRGLDLLEALSASSVPQSLSELSRQLDHAPGGVFRLLNRLERRGYVLRDPVSTKYSLSLKLFELAHTHSPVEELLRSAAGPMRELAAATGESVHLSVIRHGELVVLQDVGSPWRVRISIEAGSRFPVVNTTSGRLLLAHLSEDEQDAFLANDADFRALPANRKEALLRELRQIRRSGYAVSAVEERGGQKDIAVLTGNPAIGHAAALAIACYRRGRDKEDTMRLIAALRESAGKITQAAGMSAAKGES
jgi:DNA-binding IclR family transcriptional regulator